MPLSFTKVGVIGLATSPRIGDTLKRLGILLGKLGCYAYLDERARRADLCQDFQIVSREQLGRECELLIVVGGDGTLLDTARTMLNYEIPMVGINLGRIGFLVDVSPLEMEQTLTSILQGEYLEDTRVLLEACVTSNNETVFTAQALNDVVVHKVNVARMIEFEVYINGRFVYTQRSDGLIIATPTGSTAYSLSGGGPILHPSLAALTLVPICPHTLSNRPIVVGTDSEIEIRATRGRYEGIQISCDGQVNHKIQENDRVIIKVCPQPLRLLHPTNYDYYEILRAKLNWAIHSYQRQ